MLHTGVGGIGGATHGAPIEKQTLECKKHREHREQVCSREQNMKTGGEADEHNGVAESKGWSQKPNTIKIRPM